MKAKTTFCLCLNGMSAAEPSAAIERGALSLLFWFVGYGAGTAQGNKPREKTSQRPSTSFNSL